MNDRRVQDKPFKLGDRVLVANRTPCGRCKLKDKWEERPYEVIKQLGDLPVYAVQQLGNIHCNLLTKCPFDVEDVTHDVFPPPPLPFRDAARGVHGDFIPPLRELDDTEDELGPADASCRTDVSSHMSDSCSSTDDDQDNDTDDAPTSDAGGEARVRHHLRRIIRPPSRFGDWQ